MLKIHARMSDTSQRVIFDKELVIRLVIKLAVPGIVQNVSGYDMQYLDQRWADQAYYDQAASCRPTRCRYAG